MTSRPSGTVTFLFTDIEGSTKLWEQQDPEPMRLAVARHDAILRQAVEQNLGYLFKTTARHRRWDRANNCRFIAEAARDSAD